MILSANIIDIDMQTLVDMGALYGPYMVIKEQWWRLMSAMFLHGSMTHLLMNMFSLYLIGREAEEVFDTKSYLFLYFSAGLIGSMVSLFVHPNSVGVGASGAIFGLFGALAGFFLLHRHTLIEHSQGFMKQFGIIIGLNLVIGFSIPSVDVSAHVGGLFAGMLGGFMLAKYPRNILIYTIFTLVLLLALAYYLTNYHYAQIRF